MAALPPTAALADIAPQLRTNIQFVVAGRNASTNAVGTTPGYGKVSNAAASGRFISEADVRSTARVVVLSPSVAKNLFGDYDPVGETVHINRVPFSIIGVMESKGSSFGNDNGDIAIMPISTTRQRFSGDSLTGPDDLQMLFIGFEDGVSLPKAKREITKLLRERYRVRGKDINPFTIRTTKEFMEESAQVRGIFQIVLVAIASISLLVEAAVLCVIGGAMGLILAIAAGTALTVYADFPVPIGVGVGIGAIMFSAIIGLLFGDYPAIRASYLSPIEALRSE